jgi:hypothetical protein
MYDFVKKNKPISTSHIIPIIDVLEIDHYVKKYMNKYGIENVRGGTYFEEYLPQHLLSTLNNELSIYYYTFEEKSNIIENIFNKYNVSNLKIQDIQNELNTVALKLSKFQNANCIINLIHYYSTNISNDQNFSIMDDNNTCNDRKLIDINNEIFEEIDWLKDIINKWKTFFLNKIDKSSEKKIEIEKNTLPNAENMTFTIIDDDEPNDNYGNDCDKEIEDIFNGNFYSIINMEELYKYNNLLKKFLLIINIFINIDFFKNLNEKNINDLLPLNVIFDIFFHNRNDCIHIEIINEIVSYALNSIETLTTLSYIIINRRDEFLFDLSDYEDNFEKNAIYTIDYLNILLPFVCE